MGKLISKHQSKMKFALYALVASASALRASVEVQSLATIDAFAFAHLEAASMEDADMTPAQQAQVDAVADKSMKEMDTNQMSMKEPSNTFLLCSNNFLPNTIPTTMVSSK